MHRTRVKICGLTRADEARLAADLGADAIGLVFYPPSPRAVDIITARHIALALPPFVTTVGLFVNADPTWVRAVLRQVPLALLQFHGDETPAYCADFGRPYLKAVPMGAGASVEDYAHRYATAAALLVDSHGSGQHGGSGQPFDWHRLPADPTKPLVLAGGLSPDNVAAAICQVKPYAVDVSSGVEAAKGRKDPALLRAFLQAVRQGDSCV